MTYRAGTRWRTAQGVEVVVVVLHLLEIELVMGALEPVGRVEPRSAAPGGRRSPCAWLMGASTGKIRSDGSVVANTLAEDHNSSGCLCPVETSPRKACVLVCRCDVFMVKLQCNGHPGTFPGDSSGRADEVGVEISSPTIRAGSESYDRDGIRDAHRTGRRDQDLRQGHGPARACRWRCRKGRSACSVPTGRARRR